jgi:hypothetical protein
MISSIAPACPVQVRHARVEDHDDLLPIAAAAAAGSCPSLAALPQSCQPDQPFALTRLISSQDSQNLVLVAEDEGKLVSQKLRAPLHHYGPSCCRTSTLSPQPHPVPHRGLRLPHAPAHPALGPANLVQQPCCVCPSLRSLILDRLSCWGVLTVHHLYCAAAGRADGGYPAAGREPADPGV